ncbi:hypothetical protein RQM47_15910 [Rubrivirga sp. S365]|uniref:hypothetical protein n=1 Tax=Rubrivirga sp. S365 TaxID=3076080 RepID=UPI0028C6693F|nr:hypothetical protein [Rubrivirga sp. S365]MDT7858133.1 hypothetical protein [Rubrivirga sp. S365]
MTSSLRVGSPVHAGDPIPIEGARLLLNGPTIRALVVYEEPTPAEVEAVETGPVELGVYHADGVAAVAFRVGEPGTPGRIETHAPLVLLDGAAHVNGVTGGPCSQARSLTLALCQAEGTVVRAVRSLAVPAEVVEAARRAVRAQAARFGCAADARRAHRSALRRSTVCDLMRGAVARVRIEG